MLRCCLIIRELIPASAYPAGPPCIPSGVFWGTSTACVDMQSGCRSPEKPGTMLIKRLLALEGDWVTVPGRMEVEKIPKVRT